MFRLTIPGPRVINCCQRADSREREFDALVGQFLVAVERTHALGDERLDAVAHPLGHLAERDAGAQPGRGRARNGPALQDTVGPLPIPRCRSG